MLAAIKTEIPRKIELKDEQIPTLNEGDLLIKVESCGVCGSDLHAFTHSKGYEFVKKPIILGHEIAGVVVDCFHESDKCWIGKKVIIESMHYCNECDNCKDGRFSICEKNTVIGLHFNGGMAEYVKTKKRFTKSIQNNMELKSAALSEPLAIAVHAVKKAGEIKENQVILVQGPGIIGFFVGLVCLNKGAKVILSGLERDYQTRLAKGEQFGMIPHVADRSELTEKVDILFECSGSTVAVSGGFHQLKKGGKAIFVALYEQTVNLYLTDLVRNEWPIITSYGCDPIDYEEAFHLLVEKQRELDSIISYYSLSQVEMAFNDSLNQKVLKAMLLMHDQTGGMNDE
ncbi:zinc-dependent alcohol dehydrogenase [Bacillus massiliigorillae]|uniref:zinc-dependent alcohol dehydrogenase n=1 Tax=Bacillus massiliigorillae TaxID=1243664 RepID=UPI0003A80BDC|nr:alcohol dehydrogenase catalytic domain-containing protein [Bacillus massiliigorillae]